jgi:hypothetical protein
MAYILRTGPSHTLIWRDKSYRDGDSIPIGKADAERIALQFPRYRFEDKDGDEISFAALDTATAPGLTTVPPKTTTS